MKGCKNVNPPEFLNNGLRWNKKKSISNLLRSPKWENKIINDYLTAYAQEYVELLLGKQEGKLLLWDESVQEKPEIASKVRGYTQ